MGQMLMCLKCLNCKSSEFNPNDQNARPCLWGLQYYLKLLLNIMCVIQFITGAMYLAVVLVLLNHYSRPEDNKSFGHIMMTSSVDIMLSLFGFIALRIEQLWLLNLLSVMACWDTLLTFYGFYFMASHMISIFWSMAFAFVCCVFTYVVGPYDCIGKALTSLQEWLNILGYRGIQEPLTKVDTVIPQDESQ